jgi:hypothetical protein
MKEIEPAGPESALEVAARQFLREFLNTIQQSSDPPPNPPPPTFLVVPNTGPTIYHRAFNYGMTTCMVRLAQAHLDIGDYNFEEFIRTGVVGSGREVPVWANSHEGSQAQWYDHDKNEGWGFITPRQYRTDGGVGGEWQLNIRGRGWMNGEFRVPRVALRQRGRGLLGFATEPQRATRTKRYIPGMITFQDARGQNFNLNDMMEASRREEPPPWQQ